MKNIISSGLIQISKIKRKVKENTDWTVIPIAIASAIHLISIYSHREQKISVKANPTDKIKVVIPK